MLEVLGGRRQIWELIVILILATRVERMRWQVLQRREEQAQRRGDSEASERAQAATLFDSCSRCLLPVGRALVVLVVFVVGLVLELAIPPAEEGMSRGLVVRVR